MQVTNLNEDHAYYNLSSSIYLPKTIVIKGVNASGKTTILKVLDLIFNIFIKSEKLNDGFIKKYLDMFYLADDMKITFYYAFNEKIYKLVSTITKSKDLDELRNKQYIFLDEKIYEKNITSSLVKNTLYDANFNLYGDRAKLNMSIKTFLSNDVSINQMILQSEESNFIVVLENDNFLYNSNKKNLPFIIDDLEPNIISFLDPSIKEIKAKYILSEDALTRYSRNITYDLHFTNGNVIEVSNLQLEQMLSSGTLRGLNLLSNIKTILKTGGYIIIDELELHLNKSIIIDIIRLFKTNETNPKNATLIFTSHYTEILDIFDRNDQIYISHRNKNYKMLLSNYSDYDKKNQLKKSDSYFADTYQLGTAISYNKYYALRKSFKDQHRD